MGEREALRRVTCQRFAAGSEAATGAGCGTCPPPNALIAHAPVAREARANRWHFPYAFGAQPPALLTHPLHYKQPANQAARKLKMSCTDNPQPLKSAFVSPANHPLRKSKMS